MTGDANHNPNPPATALSEPLALRLRSTAGRLRRYTVLAGLACVGWATLPLALAQFAVDSYAGGLRWSMRATALAIILLWVVRLAWRRVWRPWHLPFGLPEVAHLIERRHPELAGVLISAVRFAGGETGHSATASGALTASVMSQASASTVNLDFDTVLNTRRARLATLSLTGVLITGIAITVAAPDQTVLWFRRNVLLRNTPWPRQTRLVVDLDDGVLTGAIGDDLTIRAHAEGIQPRDVEIVLETVSGRQQRGMMVTVGSHDARRYRYTVKNATEDFSFRLRGGDDRTNPYHAHLCERPRIAHTQMHLIPPSYTGQDPVILGNDERSARVLSGTTVTIRFRTNKPVRRAILMSGEKEIVQADPDAQWHTVTTSPTMTGTYHFSLEDEVGLTNRRPVFLSLQVVPDEPPRARLRIPDAQEVITLDAILPVELEFADSHGLATASLTYHLSGEGTGEKRIALAGLSPGARSFSTDITWSPPRTASPGDRVALQAHATDLNDVTGPGVGKSHQVTLRIATREEFLAELSRREKESRAAFERHIDTQEDLRRRLLSSVAAARMEGSDGGESDETLANLAHRQRNLAGAVNTVRHHFGQILAELMVNQLDTPNEHARLSHQVLLSR